MEFADLPVSDRVPDGLGSRFGKFTPALVPPADRLDPARKDEAAVPRGACCGYRRSMTRSGCAWPIPARHSPRAVLGT